MNVYHLDSPQRLYQHLAQDYQMYHVVESNGDSVWQKSTHNGVDYEKSDLKINRLPLMSPKSLFFSEQENLFYFDGECFRETLPQPEPFALFAVPSCDLHAIAYQDQFFSKDPYYQARRQQALLVGLDCLTPCSNGFCPTVNAGPGVSPDITDLTLHREATNLWMLIINNERGDNAIKTLALTTADKYSYRRRDQRIESCKQQFKHDEAITAGVAAINKNAVSDAEWQALAKRCLSCSGCTNVCPTCSCFATRDLDTEETDNPSGIVRQRIWDSCLYESFQREASQHNPSAEAGERVRRFWYHKFSNQFAAQFGRYGCIGCGRCEQTCPGTIGVHSVMHAIGDNSLGTNNVEKNSLGNNKKPTGIQGKQSLTYG